jgi:hypothetical protein
VQYSTVRNLSEPHIEQLNDNLPCMRKTRGYLRKTSSSCNSYEGGLFPFVPFQSGAAQAPGRKLDTGGQRVIDMKLGSELPTYQIHDNTFVNYDKI